MVCVKRPTREKSFVSMDGVEDSVLRLLDDVQREMFEAARVRRDSATHAVDSYDEFKSRLEETPGFLLAHWCGSRECEDRVQEETKATIRCLTFDQPEEAGRCILCGSESKRRVHFAKAY